MKRKILVLGAGGQLGMELLHTVRPEIECVALARQELDIGDAAAVAHCLSAQAPVAIINAAAYTAVDAAEDNAAAAHRANAQGPANLARSCRELGIRLVHVSTDFVFDGAASEPYAPDAVTAPLEGNTAAANWRVSALCWSCARRPWCCAAAGCIRASAITL